MIKLVIEKFVMELNKKSSYLPQESNINNYACEYSISLNSANMFLSWKTNKQAGIVWSQDFT